MDSIRNAEKDDLLIGISRFLYTPKMYDVGWVARHILGHLPAQRNVENLQHLQNKG